MWLIRELAPAEVDRVGDVLGLARLGQGAGFYLVLWEGDEPLGHAYLALNDPPELQDVAVRPEHRRRGVASALAGAAERATRARGLSRLRITVSVDNEEAQTLYRGLGYRDAGVPPRRVHGTIRIRTGPLEVDDTLLTWEKSLAGPSSRRPMKLVAIGIGSAIFGIELLRDVFRLPEFRGAELWLVDTDPDALARMAKLADRLNEAAGWEVQVHRTRDRLEALGAADFVVTSVAVDRIATWRTDHALALSHGFASVLSENGGPGGLSHTLRSVPLMVEIGQDVERLAPNALMFNYTNPENRVCLAMRRHTNTRVVGLCHSVAEAIDRCARTLDRPRSEIDVQAAGVNHFTWFTSVRDARDGSDLMPELRRRTMAGDRDRAPLSHLVIERLGVLPAIDDDHVGEYLPWAAEVIGTAGYDFERHERRSRADIEMLAAWGSGDRPVERLLAEPSQEARVDHSAAEIMGDVFAHRTLRRPSFILPNEGYIDNLPLDSVVEVPGIVDAGVARGLPVGALPEHVAALVRHELAIQDVAVEAAVEGSRDLALRALLLDPVVTSVRAAERFLDDILEVHRAHLPRFWS